MKKHFILLLLTLTLTLTCAAASAATWQGVVNDLSAICNNGGGSLDDIVDELREIALQSIKLSWDGKPVVIKNGETKTINVHYDDQIGTSFYYSWRLSNNACSVSAPSGTDNNLPFTITAKGVGTCILTVWLTDMPENSIQIPIECTMSDAEASTTSKVKYIGDRSVGNYKNEEMYRVFFALKDQNKGYLRVPAKATINITNKKGENVYSAKHQIQTSNYSYWSNKTTSNMLLAVVEIPYSSIQAGRSEDGTVSLFVELYDGSTFKAYEMDIYFLPTVDPVSHFTLDAPETPAYIAYYNSSNVLTTVSKITSIQTSTKQANATSVDVTINLNGEKTYDYKGSTATSSQYIHWILYDEQDKEVKSGYVTVNGKQQGEPFSEEITLRYVETGHYHLVFRDEQKPSEIKYPSETIISLPKAPTYIAEYLSGKALYTVTEIASMQASSTLESNGTVTVKIQFAGTKIYDYHGESGRSNVEAYWQLYDASGKAVKNGSKLMTSLRQGQQFSETITISNLEPGKYSFIFTDAKKLSEINIPVDPTIILPKLPKEIVNYWYNGKVWEKTYVNKIDYEFSNVYSDGTMNVTFSFSGEKTYDSQGAGVSNQVRIGWKLYDEDGYVVDSGTAYTKAVRSGELYKNCTSIASDLEPGHTYRLELLDVR